RKQAEQDKGADQSRRQNVRHIADCGELGSRVHVNHRTRQHPDLAHQVIDWQPHGGQAHGEVDQEKGKGRNQA
ncbi:hypothetical protein EY05_14875, partial [Staphylococcus aureus]